MAKPTEPSKIIYSMVGVGKVQGTRQVLKDISLSYFYGAKIGVLGLNGAGKSTLLRIMAGVETEFIGETHCSPGYTIGLLEQEPKLDPAKTVQEVVREGVQETVALLREFEEISGRFAERMSEEEMNTLLDRQGKVQDRLDAASAWDLDSRLELAMDALRCPPGDAPVRILSGGERNRLHLARMLRREANVILLDEPTNDLDVNTMRALEDAIDRYAGCVLVISHDRWFLDRVATHILAFEGDSSVTWFEGNGPSTTPTESGASASRPSGRTEFGIGR